MIIVKKELIEKLVVDETMELLMNDVLFEQLTDKFISLHRKRIHTCCFKKRACVDTKRRNRKQTQRNLAGSINNFYNVKMGIMLIKKKMVPKIETLIKIRVAGQSILFYYIYTTFSVV